MTSNLPEILDVYNDLQRVLAKLQALDADKIESANLVPMVKAVQAVAAYGSALHSQIEQRAIGNGELLPGVVVKDAVTHRKWNDEAIAATLAFEQFGLKAFALSSPAAIAKLGDEGAALVSVASFKPAAGKKATY